MDKDNSKYTKWVACWGNATSITDRKEAVYAKDITLRYPVKMCFDGCSLRFHFSNLTGTENVTITKAFVEKLPVLFNNNTSATIPAGQEIVSDAVAINITKGQTVNVSLYFGDYTQLNAGTLITGPLSGGKYSYGDYALADELPVDLTRSTSWYYFINTIDILTEDKNHALICYGDSITAQSWPDYLSLRAEKQGFNDISIIRRAVSGTRILRQYDCITYQAYGLKGETRFPIEMNVAGATAVIIQHGINDIIHPVGKEVNVFRPWSDMPTVQDLVDGVTNIYIKRAKALGYKVYGGTLLPIQGWRTYNEDREAIRNEFNNWIRLSPLFDGCIDFDKAVRDSDNPKAFAPGFDSGDHLHPSEKAYNAMAECIDSNILV